MSEPTPQEVAPDQAAPDPPGLLRRTGRAVLRRAVDAGLVGERLQRHVVVCGYPRSGSTLLQLMVDACVDGVDSFTGEVEGRWAAEHAPRRRPYLLTKRPADVEEVAALRAWYARHPGRLQVVVTERDPRDVLVSRHSGYPPSRGYYCSPQRWRRVHDLLGRLGEADDVVRVRYEELVTDPAAVERRLADAVGWSVQHPFAQWHAVVQHGRLDRMTQGALGGVRPLDASSVGGWRRPEHAGRMAQVRAALPELDDVLASEGWEP
ncbi:sulfotransferase family protein [Pseudokineococcus sp. 1T1Z-3]|uniref:sulfotransferase family protein n=1 Tax=Pseudokineococcus sp. 1T1Z-3 TaxID=3132745 RepID=UPI0030A2B4E3